jgi:hypothetical protein
LSVVRRESFDDALALVNAHEYGNGAAIFTRDGDAAQSFLSCVKAGMVGVNVPIPVPIAFHSFGGWKRSLFGDHHVHGPEGVRFYYTTENGYDSLAYRDPRGCRVRNADVELGRFTQPRRGAGPFRTAALECRNPDWPKRHSHVTLRTPAIDKAIL